VPAPSKDNPSDRPPTAATPVPIGLDEVIGQDHALKVIGESLASGRIHHAWIFAGPEGVGKFTTALALAACLLDPTSRPDLSGRIRPDSESPVQRLLASGLHPDLHVVTKELARYHPDPKIRQRKLTSIPVEVIRLHVIEPATVAPSVASGAMAHKVFIIDEAHLLGLAAQNTLLKTLEEPPIGTVVILITASEDLLLATIRSRCQRVAFFPLDAAAMDRWIDRAGIESGGGIGGELGGRARLLEVAGGSPGVLREALDAGLDQWVSTLGAGLDRIDAGAYPVSLAADLASLIDEHATRQAARSPQTSKEMAKKQAARTMLGLVADHYRRRLHDVARSDNPDRVHGALAAIEAVARAERLIGNNVQIGFVFEDLISSLQPVGVRIAPGS